MIAAQYSFTLPATFPISDIETRVRNLGHKLDSFPGLGFKAYLLSTQQAGSKINRYAPFYLWKSETGLVNFLKSDGFRGLEDSFGRPQVIQTLPLTVYTSDQIKQATFAVRDSIPVYPDNTLSDLFEQEDTQGSLQKQDTNCVAYVASLGKVRMSLMSFSLIRETAYQGESEQEC
ncbi:DUF4865 family protein [Marinomonas mediterranea]|jgi:hypothetical protein|uniref:DUF4865 domain-containing protein n=1 Tax=Marinomonas mediterranea (strain ATCC 700492 / JCM 21426 / NBRC 103028 / MMB-1) TaxID=717774 RepID=F2JUJ2_MARM1|nr:DUF4865 family protein [Marinomonas mediterranea]ADZ89325.1 hypothetical protein Marme_0019 [Marinomonas mediterranea MMB-1]WCN15592.1 DUF4865 family protein [Marinomonas mediterranea MMB-1]